MPVKTIQVFSCDICSSDYNPKEVEVSEYTREVVEAIRIIGYYKPIDQSTSKYICRKCSNTILDTISNLKHNYLKD